MFRTRKKQRKTREKLYFISHKEQHKANTEEIKSLAKGEKIAI